MPKKTTRRTTARPKAALNEHLAKAVLAHSDAAPPDQERRTECLRCIAQAFDAIGITHVDDPSDQIVWGSLEKSDCNQLANDLESCLGSKGWDVPSLAAIFQFLRENERVMNVGSLIDALIQISA